MSNEKPEWSIRFEEDENLGADVDDIIVHCGTIDRDVLSIDRTEESD